MTKTLNDLTRDFLLNEGEKRSAPLKAWIQALEENLLKVEARSQTDARRLEIMKEQIKEIKRNSRRLEEHLAILQEENGNLQEQVKILQEKKDSIND
jgi:vacuolar-type H+-ATPase subunit I/STV1